ncbi:glycosyltransferase family 2 protein [Rufibacter tibetensis]|uniref:Glycosyltransferase 2-like domain-containing protein n=1 Tax=Rufibacter tibetensis TaxID=512763 RepID=A0A0P0C4H7_9BACT|nr:glycosyltransferase family 2 protein [Rufibacter tibetensis]ALI99747.1 hypothetical protein DC20_13160 [Rufibacter tibetensis]
MAKLSIIIPCYFNENNIPVTASELIANESRFPLDLLFEYVFVDDGSEDNTYRELIKLKETYPDKVKVVKLVKNVGSYNAVVAGMEYATGDCLVIISADLQDPPELMVKMYEYWLKGFKLVIGSRQERHDSVFQKLPANFFHFIMKKIAFNKLPQGGFDYVLFDKAIGGKVVEMSEQNSNIMYLMAWMGYDYVNIPYVRSKRKIGKTRWTFKKRLKLFLDSVFSFSNAPIRAVSGVGLLLGFIFLLYALYLMINRFFNEKGWSVFETIVLFATSFHMIALGLLGEYVWRTLDASKKRPLYIVDKVL